MAHEYSLELLSDGRQSEAEKVIEGSLRTNTDDERLVFAKAVLSLSRWDKTDGRKWLRTLQRKKDGGYISEVAALTLALLDHEDADQNMKTLVGLSDNHPADTYLLWLTAIQCREQGEGRLGKRRYEKLLETFRLGPVMVHHTYANILTENLDLYEEALPHRYMAVSMEPTSWTLEGLANTLTDKGDYPWANAIWAKLVRMEPRNHKYWYRHGYTFRMLQRFSEAVEAQKKSTALDPESIYAWAEFGICLEMIGRNEEAAHCFSKVEELGNDVETLIFERHFFARKTGASKTIVRPLPKEGETAEDVYYKYLVRLSEQLQEKIDQGTLNDPPTDQTRPSFVDGPCECLNEMVKACEASGRLELAIQMQNHLVGIAERKSGDERAIKAQRVRLVNLRKKASAGGAQ